MGGTSGWMFVHPFDVLKVRMQIHEGARQNPIKVFMKVFQTEGINGLYGGLSAAVTRQCTYTTLRLGLYDVIRNKVAGESAADKLPLWKKLCIGLSAGGTAASICCPVEVSLVRMQADGASAPELRRNYNHAFDAMARVYREEGLSALYRGVGPTVVRGMIVSATQLATYDQAKTVFKTMFEIDGVKLHLSSSLFSGFVYCVASLPMDITKTRMQNQRPDANGVLPYRSIPQALMKIPAQEGVFALWKGFGPYFARGGGHTIGMFLFVEQYRKMFRNCLGINQE